MARLSLSEPQVLVACGLAVGVGAGLGAVVFRLLIGAFTDLFFTHLEPALARVLGPAAVVLIPALGGLIFAPLIYFCAREAKGHGVPEMLRAVALRGGRIRPAVAVINRKAEKSGLGARRGGPLHGLRGILLAAGQANGSSQQIDLRVQSAILAA